MRDHDIRCQCKRMGIQCASDMTAEDLLCNSCRQGCTSVMGPVGWNPDTSPDDTTPVEAYHFAMTSATYGPMHWPDGGTAV